MRSRRSKSNLLRVVLTMFIVSACSSSEKNIEESAATAGSDQPSGSGEQTGESETQDDEPTAELEATSTTTSTTTSTSTTTTTLPETCPTSWSAVPRTTSGWPYPVASGGSFILSDAEIGAHSYFDRFVLDFDGSGDLSYDIRWLASPPIIPEQWDGSAWVNDAPVIMDGNKFLQVRTIARSTSDISDPSEWYSGPDDLDGNAVGAQVVNQGKMTEDFEGYLGWTLGVEHFAAFNVFTLENPKRLVVDICREEDSAASQATSAGCLGEWGFRDPDWIEGVSLSGDIDGVAGDEIVTTFADPSISKWWMEIAADDGSWRHISLVPGSSLVFEAQPLGFLDMDEDGVKEVFMQTDGGAYSFVFRVFVFDDCELQKTRNSEGGDISWPVGASAMNMARATCTEFGMNVESAQVTGDETWSVDVNEIVLSGIAWEPLPVDAGWIDPSYETPDLEPPFAPSLDCEF